MHELDRYLQDQTGDGQLQSSGVFTQTWEKAMAKLGGFALPGPHHWILKVVQSAVAAGSKQIDLEFSRQATVLAFDKGCSLEELQQAFFQPERTPAPALQHLRVALWAAGYAGRRPFQYFPANCSEYLDWNGKQMEVKSHGRASGKNRLSLSAPPIRGSGPLIWFAHSHSQDELELLKSCACACPIPICHYFSGVPLDTLMGSLRLHQFYSPGHHLPSRAGQKYCCHTIVGLSQSKQPSLIRWIQDGVVVSQDELDGPSHLFVHLLVSVEELATDIGGFRLIESAEKETRKASILGAVAIDLNGGGQGKVAGAYRAEVRRSDPDGKAKGWVLMGVGGLTALADIWGTGGSTLIFPAIIGLTGVCYRRWSVSLAIPPATFQQELAEFCQRWDSLVDLEP